MRPMRIALLGPVSWRVPPQHYGGWELVTANLADGLVREGHEVTVFASLDSATTAAHDGVVPHALSEDPDLAADGRAWETLHLAHAFDQARSGRFDVLHNHAGSYAVPWGPLAGIPFVTTLHGSGAERDSRILYGRHRDLPYVSITDAERVLVPDLNYVATVFNGITVDALPFGDAPGDDLVCIGRMSPDKGIAQAIEVAERSGRRLVLAGIVPPENTAYFDEVVRPRLVPGRVEFIGPVDHEEKGALLAGAYAFLHLVTYHEAFGLTMAESLACGTPVIGMRRGSVPELVRDGVTGAVVDDVDGAVAAVANLTAVDRAQCRADAEERFSVTGMTRGYVRVYSALTGGRV